MRTTIYQRNKELWEQAKSEAESMDRSLSWFLEYLIKFYFKCKDDVNESEET